MRWLAITISDLYNSKSATLIDQINQNLLGAGQTDRVTGIIADVTLEVRRKVAVQYSIDIDPTKIPGGLKTLAVDMIYCRLKIAAEMTLSEDERIALRKCVTDLDRIADGKDMVDQPDNPEPSGQVMQSANPIEYHANRRRAKNHQSSGLL